MRTNVAIHPVVSIPPTHQIEVRSKICLCREEFCNWNCRSCDYYQACSSNNSSSSSSNNNNLDGHEKETAGRGGASPPPNMWNPLVVAAAILRSFLR